MTATPRSEEQAMSQEGDAERLNYIRHGRRWQMSHTELEGHLNWLIAQLDARDAALASLREHLIGLARGLSIEPCDDSTNEAIIIEVATTYDEMLREMVKRGDEITQLRPALASKDAEIERLSAELAALRAERC